MSILVREDFHSEVSQLKERFSVHFNIEEHTQKGFTGAESMIVVVGFIISGIAGGFLKSIGSDMWALIKNVSLKIFNKAKTTEQKTIIKIETTLPHNKKQLLFYLSLDKEKGEELFDDFIQSLIKKASVIQSEAAFRVEEPGKTANSKVRYEYKDGNWIIRES